MVPARGSGAGREVLSLDLSLCHLLSRNTQKLFGRDVSALLLGFEHHLSQLLLGKSDGVQRPRSSLGNMFLVLNIELTLGNVVYEIATVLHSDLVHIFFPAVPGENPGNPCLLALIMDVFPSTV